MKRKLCNLHYTTKGSSKKEACKRSTNSIHTDLNHGHFSLASPGTFSGCYKRVNYPSHRGLTCVPPFHTGNLNFVINKKLFDFKKPGT